MPLFITYLLIVSDDSVRQSIAVQLTIAQRGLSPTTYFHKLCHMAIRLCVIRMVTKVYKLAHRVLVLIQLISCCSKVYYFSPEEEKSLKLKEVKNN